MIASFLLITVVLLLYGLSAVLLVIRGRKAPQNRQPFASYVSIAIALTPICSFVLLRYKYFLGFQLPTGIIVVALLISFIAVIIFGFVEVVRFFYLRGRRTTARLIFGLGAAIALLAGGFLLVGLTSLAELNVAFSGGSQISGSKGEAAKYHVLLQEYQPQESGIILGGRKVTIKEIWIEQNATTHYYGILQRRKVSHTGSHLCLRVSSNNINWECVVDGLCRTTDGRGWGIEVDGVPLLLLRQNLFCTSTYQHNMTEAFQLKFIPPQADCRQRREDYESEAVTVKLRTANRDGSYLAF